MSLLQKLHQAEETKNYERFCEIADEILSSEESVISPLLVRQIRARKDFYIFRLINEQSKLIQAWQIVRRIDIESLKVLKKCCPGLNCFIHSQANGIDSMSSHQPLGEKDALLDALITKNKELRIFWDFDYKTVDQDVYYFQVLLEAEFRINPLRCKESQQASVVSNDFLIELDNEFMPIFIVHYNKKTTSIDSVKCIFFPSALRGSYHYAELVDCCSEYTGYSAVDQFSKNFVDTKDNPRLQQITIIPQNYDIGLLYSNEDFRRWVNVVHNIEIEKDCLFNSKNNVLHLPENSYPTISLIINGFTSTCSIDLLDSADILIVDDSDYEPLYKLSAKFPENNFEEQQKKETVFPYIRNQSTKFYTESALSILQSTNDSPLALHPPQNPILNFSEYNPSIKSNGTELLIIVKVTDASSVSEEFFLSIICQQSISISYFVFFVSSEDENALKMQYKSLASKWSWKIKSVFNCEPEYLNSLMKKIPATLFVNQYIILQDPNTLKMLADNLQRKQSFSSGCMLSHLQSAKKKQLYFNNSTGLYLSFNSYSETGRIVLEAKNIIKSLPPTEIFVLSNHYDLGLYNSKLLLSQNFSLNHLDDLDLLLVQAACNASLNGLHNICTTKVCAIYLRSPTLNMSLTIDSNLSRKIIENLSSLMNQITSVTRLCS